MKSYNFTKLFYGDNLRLIFATVLIFVFTNNISYSQDDETILEYFNTKNATFQGGDVNKFRLWVQQNLIYPKEAANADIGKKVIVQFTVDSLGFVVDTKVLRGISPVINKEALRILNSSPKWNPGMEGNKIVSQKFVIPIVFSKSDSISLKK
jgi:TonB family protein